MKKRYRLVTRDDIDGVMCGALLNELDMIDDIYFVNPNDMQKGKIEITDRDIIANLPYNKNAHLNFDHHESERLRIPTFKKNFILDTEAKSVSRVIFNYFGGSKVFNKIDWKIIKQIDNVKGNGISYNDILYPNDWVLLSIILDSRTGLEKFVGTEITNEKIYLLIDFIDKIADIGVKNFLKEKDIQERITVLEKYNEKFKEQIHKCTKIIHHKIILLDKRNEKTIYPGNRFYVFTSVEEEVDYSINLFKTNKDSKDIKIAIRHNPLSNKKGEHIGNILYQFNGGGNLIAGTCVVKENEVEETLEKLYNLLI